MDFEECESLANRLMSALPPTPGWGKRDVKIWIRDQCRCVYCGMDMLQSYNVAFYFYHYDHLLPKAVYGELEDEDWNRVLSCSACNQIKHTFDPNVGPTPTYKKDSKQQPSNEQRARLLDNAKRHIQE